MPETIIELLASGDANAAAIAAPGREPLTYEALRDEVARLAGQLRALGVERGERVAIVLPDGPEMVVAFLAVAICATVAPLNPAYREEEFRFYLDDLNAKALVTRAGEAAEAHAAAPASVLRVALEGDAGALRLSHDGAPVAPVEPRFAAPDDVALVLHTSGTTSRPKLVPLTQRNLTTSATNIVAALALGEADRCLNVMPLFHIHGLIAAVLSSLASGGCVACTPGFDAFRFFDWLDELKPSWYTAVPTMHQLILTRAGRNSDVIGRNPLRFPALLVGVAAAPR